jgi:hypothetical protein
LFNCYKVKWHTKKLVDRQKILEIQNQSIDESKCSDDRKLLQEILSLDKNDQNMNVEKIPTLVVISLYMQKLMVLLLSNKKKYEDLMVENILRLL